MRALRGTAVFPLVTLDSRPMKTKIGTKLRPEFSITDWRDLGGNGKPALESAPPRAIEAKTATPVGKPVKAPTTTEAVNDEIPF
jgi:hypothetical protein